MAFNNTFVEPMNNQTKVTNKSTFSFLILYFITLLISPFFTKKATAQILPDNTLPNNSQVQPGCQVCQINGGTVRDSNLFHSFKEFSISTNGQAIFNNGLEIQNILIRVTGNNISYIDGLIRANGSANLFFINPNGIVFGNNATLNINGSFVASTANSIKFADGTQFSNKAAQSTPLLTITTPIGLQFGTNQGKIQVQAKNGLQIQPNQTLALVGGDINLEGAIIKTNGGRLELGSVKETSLVKLTSTNQIFSLNYDGINKFGNIQLTAKTDVDTSGIGGGEIQIQTGNLRISEGSRITSSTRGSLPGGNITVNATDTLEIIGTGEFEEKSAKILDPSPEIYQGLDGFFILSSGARISGDLNINTDKLILKNGAIIMVSVFEQGKGGDINVSASNSVEVSESLLVTANPLARVGDAGNISIKTGNLLLQKRGIIASTSFGTGKAGDISIYASESLELTPGQSFLQPSIDKLINTNINSSTLSSGKAGNVEINTRELTLRDKTNISASTFGSGNGGNLTVNASDIQLFGTDSHVLSSGFFASSGLRATGSAGDIKVSTSTLHILDHATITVEALGTGNAGSLSLKADSILMENFATITGNSRSNTTGLNQEQASINLNSQALIMRNGSKITTNATGNNIIGGNITINTAVLAALENSDITANSTDFRGGQVKITAQGIFGTQFRDQVTPESDITATGASAEFSGTVEINQLSADPNQGSINLSTSVIDTDNQVAQRCGAGSKFANQENKFTIIGRGGLPSNPNDLLTGITALVDLVELVPEARTEESKLYQLFSQDSYFHHAALVPSHESNKDMQPVSVTSNLPTEIVEAQGWVVDVKGQVHLVAQAANVLPHSPILAETACSTR
ncbi:filamentous hemagglutinin N-terminal domain-containing protein [Anabaena sphaerica FACHB-251]|uniref:Filamentous hemagglutinin N-terminal domain-containing protein n=1 Tax=Anabaena sphaerica FACHB-251 TaxID=2692883 RepID=A0A926WJJ6_9NOST|nr:filamentous hemagglutinin N-terminal domain-containing protein [Anabaena sphaerica]MBD2295779.1 filamentous hemagglutinin N-terminal domain-containing protein [Anabaena sphaerica FACHB-251]